MSILLCKEVIKHGVSRDQEGRIVKLRSRSGPGLVPGQVQKVQGLRTKDLDLG